jgi:FKBP-type peptidyl-prolyl cis-trans isomerase/uncharacterized damage-inducible protein DinB
MSVASRTFFAVFATCAIAAAQRGGPPSPEIRAGTQLDVAGQTAEAKKLFQKAIDSAKDPAAKANAQRAMAMSYAFDGDCKNTGKYEQLVIDYWTTEEESQPGNAFYQEGEMANEAARVCIDNGDLDAAERWYRKGQLLGLKEPNISPGRRELWQFRTEHALARIAARRGDKAEAQKHVAAARAVLDRMQKDDAQLYGQQQVFLPYLTGYVALYTGDLPAALADLQKANTSDAFIQCLIGMTYEKMGQKDQALEWYRKGSDVGAHNPPTAFAKPFTRKKLAEPAAPAKMPEVKGPVQELAALRHIDITPGEGAPAAWGKEFSVHYTGWLRDGTQFDSSAGKKPLKFVQGRRQVIAGFDIAFEGMKVGGKRRVFIPYQLAYGEQQRGKIPPHSELIFDIELVDVKDASPNSGPAADLLLPFSELQEHAVALAKAIPEDKFDWRPAPGVRSIREVCLHIAYGNRLMLNISNGPEKEEIQKQIEDQLKREVEPLSKEQVVQAMVESFQTVREALQSASAGSLSRDIDFFGAPTTRRGVLAALDTHAAEHMGQLIAYARMNGIVPPWSK